MQHKYAKILGRKPVMSCDYFDFGGYALKGKRKRQETESISGIITACILGMSQIIAKYFGVEGFDRFELGVEWETVKTFLLASEKVPVYLVLLLEVMLPRSTGKNDSFHRRFCKLLSLMWCCSFELSKLSQVAADFHLSSIRVDCEEIYLTPTRSPAKQWV